MTLNTEQYLYRSRELKEIMAFSFLFITKYDGHKYFFDQRWKDKNKIKSGFQQQNNSNAQGNINLLSDYRACSLYNKAA